MSARDIISGLLAQAEMIGSSPETIPPRTQTIEAQLPDLTTETMEALGIEVVNMELDQSALQKAAQRNPEMRRRHLAIVRGPSDSQFLLKTELTTAATKLERWQQLQRFQHEIIASRLGRAVEYSVLPMKVVWWNNAMHIASPYQAESDDVNHFDPAGYENPEAVYQRFVFNVWINSTYDAASQAIKTSAAHYIAVDINASHDSLSDQVDDNARWGRIRKIAARKGFGKIFTSDESAEHIQEMIRRIKAVSDTEIDSMLADYIGPSEERDRIITSLKWRRDHIAEIVVELQGEETVS